VKKFYTALFSILFTLILAPLAHAEAISAAKVLELVNAERIKAGLSAVAFESRLTQAAQIKASDMAAKNYFEHVSPDGIDPWDLLAQVGYDWAWAGENLALNSQTLSEEAIVKAWMDSPGHRAIILTSSHTQTGIGITPGTYNGQAVVYVSQFFASPKVEDNAPELPKPEPEATMIYHSESKQSENMSAPVVGSVVKAETNTQAKTATQNKFAATKVEMKADLINFDAATTSADIIASATATEPTRTPKNTWRIKLSFMFDRLFSVFIKTTQAFYR
jgi:hypothetical protein